MTQPKKTWDCVEMKRNAQRKLCAEYNSRKDEFSSYFAFLESRATESPWQREFWAKVATARTKAGR